MLLSAEQHTRLAASLKRAAAKPDLPPGERKRLLENAERHEVLSIRARLIELRREVSYRNSVHDLMDTVSKLFTTKLQMQAVLAELEGLGKEQGAEKEYLKALSELRAMLEKSNTLRDFLVEARRWREFPEDESR